MTSLLRHAAAALAAAALIAACRSQDGRSPAPDTARQAPSDTAPTGARLVGQIGDLHGPESVKYDPDQDVYFISNMLGFGSVKDSNGYIVRVDAKDLGNLRIVARGGANGVALDAPKGMAIHGDTLWVTDIDKLRAFDRHTFAPLATIDLAAQGAVLLNDIAVGPDGRLYITDTGIDMSPKGVIKLGGDKILAVGPGGAAEVIARAPQVTWPNGITWDAGAKRWIVVNFDPFNSVVYTLPATPAPGATPTVLAKGKGRFDGVELLRDGRMLVTCWNDSSVHLIGNGKDEQVVRNVAGPADIGLDTRRNRLLIPSSADRVDVWQLPEH